jgi:hypothetical protein
MPKTRKVRRLADAYRFPGFRTLQTVHGIFGDAHARLIRLVRRGKKPSAEPVGRRIGVGTTAGNVGHGICRAGTSAFIWNWRYDAFSAVGVVA